MAVSLFTTRVEDGVLPNDMGMLYSNLPSAALFRSATGQSESEIQQTCTGNRALCSLFHLQIRT